MIAKAERRLITAVEFDRRGDTEGRELIRGKLRRKTMGARSSEVQTYLSAILTIFVQQKRLGKVFDSECSYACFPDKPNQVRKPDVSFISQARMPAGGSPEGSFLIAPDLVVEVISPNERVGRLQSKLSDFRSVNMPLIWVIHSELRMVQVYELGQPIRELQATDDLVGEPVLPGFRVKVADIFVPSES